MNNLNNKNKFRIYDFKEKRFLPYSCWLNTENGEEFMAFDRYFEFKKDSCAAQQFIGVFDKNMKPIYEGDVIEFDTFEGTAVGVVEYWRDYCSYALDSDIGVVPFMNVNLESLAVIGNIIEDYVWNVEGNMLIKKYE